MLDVGVVTVTIIKLSGSVAGTALALIYLQPKTKADFITRSAFSIISGLVFSEAVRDLAHWPDTGNYQVASAALTAMLSWFVMGAVTRMISALDLINIIKAWRSKG